MQHNDIIRERLSFMEIDARQQSVLATIKSIIAGGIGGALDRFYRRARATPETAAFFGDEAHMARAKQAQSNHWLHIMDGTFDEQFYQSVRRIGSTHARIGLEPRWYIAAYSLVLEDFLHLIGRKLSPWRRALTLFRAPSAAEASAAVIKAALLDLELSISIYFEEAQAERTRAIETLATSLRSLAAGNLTDEPVGLPASFEALERHYVQALRNLRGLIGSVADGTTTIRMGAEEIAQASEDLARRTEGNAASLEQTATSVTQMDGRLKAAAAAASRTVGRADQAIATVGSGRAVADEAVQAMGRVADSAKGIDSVIEGLDKIAFQTRVLAMNAAVEAGRAGEAGRGFAVVADLVSALAMRSEEEAKRAREQLTATQSDIVTAVGAVQKVDGALSDISGDVRQVHELLASMATDNLAQAEAISQVSAAVGSMDRATQQNAAMVEETSAAARNLTGEVERLAGHAAQFTTERRASARPDAPVGTIRDRIAA